MYVKDALRSVIPSPVLLSLTATTATVPAPPAYSPYSPSTLTNSHHHASSPIQISPAKTIQPILTSSSSSDSTATISSSFSSTASIESNDSSVCSYSENLLETIFPSTSPIHLLPTTSVSLSSVAAESWQGAVIEHTKAGTRTLYVVGGSYEEINLRESVCSVLEFAEDGLGCTGVVMVLQKDSPDLGPSFLPSSFSIITS